MKIYVKAQGTLKLTQRHFVAKGGEGDVYVHGDVAYKIFHDAKKALPLSKVRELAKITDDHVIKPETLVMAGPGGPAIGYAMPFVRDADPLCRLFPRAFKERQGLDVGHIHEVIEGLASRVRGVHAGGALIVDLNEMNFLVRVSTRAVFAIDADSYQTASHPATAIMPNIQDPRTLSEPFDELSDWYSFAVLSCQLLLGVHPFKGKHPQVKGLAERMRRGLSVFDPAVRLPPVAYPLAVVPDAWKAWYRAVLNRHERQPPPRSMTGEPIVLSPAAPLTPTAALSSTLLLDLAGDIRALLSLPDGGFSALTSGGIYRDDVHRSSAAPVGAVLGATSNGTAIAAWLVQGHVQILDIDNQLRLDSSLMADSLMSVRERIYLKHDDKIVELLTHDVGSCVVASSRWVARVLPHATQLYDGVAIQSLLGATYVSLFPASGMHQQVRLRELDSLHILAARADGDATHGSLLVVMARDQAGNDVSLTFRIAPDGQRYDVAQCVVANLFPTACAVLDSGLAIRVEESGSLEAFAVTVGNASRRRIDADLIGGVHLSAHHGQLVCARGKRVYRLTSHGQTKPQDRKTNVVQT